MSLPQGEIDAEPTGLSSRNDTFSSKVGLPNAVVGPLELMLPSILPQTLKQPEGAYQALINSSIKQLGGSFIDNRSTSSLQPRLKWPTFNLRKCLLMEPMKRHHHDTFQSALKVAHDEDLRSQALNGQ
ncbi:MAG: hypothetical protein Q9166_004940 [cf. Caloplaca sp. 2 TL-2023]